MEAAEYAEAAKALENREASSWVGLQRAIKANPLFASRVDDCGMLLLHRACGERSLTMPKELAVTLLQANPNSLYETDNEGYLPVHIAIKAHKKLDWIKKLVMADPSTLWSYTPGGYQAVAFAKAVKVTSDVLRFLKDQMHLEEERKRTNESMDRKPLPCETSTRLLGRTVVSLPPRWKNSSMCHLCEKSFGAFKNRHHCRNCGESICRDHSAPHKLSLPHFGLEDRQRICTACYEKIVNAESSELLPSITAPVPPPNFAVVDRGSFGTVKNNDIHLQTNQLVVAASATSGRKKSLGAIFHEQEQREKLLITNGGSSRKLISGGSSSTSILNTASKKDSASSNETSAKNQLLLAYEEYRHSVVSNHEEEKSSTRESKKSAVGAESSTSSLLNQLEDKYLNRKPKAVAEATTRRLIPSRSSLSEDEFDHIYGAGEFSGKENSFMDEAARDTYLSDSGVFSPRGTAAAALENEMLKSTPSAEENTMMKLGISMLDNGSCSGAIAAFQRAAELRPDDPIVYEHLGRALYQDGDLEGAADAIVQSLELEPSSKKFSLLSQILAAKGDHEDAVQAYNLSLDSPHSASAADETYAAVRDFSSGGCDTLLSDVDRPSID